MWRASGRPVSVLLAAVVLVAVATGSCARRGQREAEMASPTSSAVAEEDAVSLEVILADVASGTDPGGELVSGTVELRGGSERSYQLYVPSSVDVAPVPLVIALHGGLGWGEQFRINSGFDRLAEANGFLIAYPDGTRIVPGRPNRVWNGGACCGVASDDRRGVDDVGFISALIDEVSETYAVDSARIYATGHSNGAIMSYRLACELADRIVAVAFQSGSLEIDDCEPAQPISVAGLHGLDDSNIPINGGAGDGPSGHVFTSPTASIETFADLNECSLAAALFDPVNDDISGMRWSSCDGDVSIEWIVARGANHAWMGHRTSAALRLLTGTPYPDLDASLTIWRLLSAHSRP